MASEAEHGKVDNGVYAAGLELVQPFHRIGYGFFLKEVRTVIVGIFRIHEEHVFMD